MYWEYTIGKGISSVSFVVVVECTYRVDQRIEYMPALAMAPRPT